MTRNLRSNFHLPENFEFPDAHPRTRRQERTIADPNAVVAVPETWNINPYHGKFNPSPKTGQQIFEKKTKGLATEDRLTASKKDSQKLRRFFQARSASLGAVVTRIPVEYDATGAVISHGNLLTQYSFIEMERLQREAHKRYSNEVAESNKLPLTPFSVTALDPANDADDKTKFYSRVDSQVVAELIKNVLTNADYTKLMLKKSIFTFEDDATGIDFIDGPCLRMLLMDRVDPNIVVGIEVLCAKPESIKLHSFNNNVDAMLTDTEEMKSQKATSYL